MTKLEQIEELLSEMTAAEKAQLLQHIARSRRRLSRHRILTQYVRWRGPDCAGTRIPVWVLEQARRVGTSEADLLKSYPALRAEDLATAWAYVRSHSDEIGRAIRENEEA